MLPRVRHTHPTPCTCAHPTLRMHYAAQSMHCAVTVDPTCTLHAHRLATRLAPRLNRPAVCCERPRAPSSSLSAALRLRCSSRYSRRGRPVSLRRGLGSLGARHWAHSSHASNNSCVRPARTLSVIGRRRMGVKVHIISKMMLIRDRNSKTCSKLRVHAHAHVHVHVVLCTRYA